MDSLGSASVLCSCSVCVHVSHIEKVVDQLDEPDDPVKILHSGLYYSRKCAAELLLQDGRWERLYRLIEAAWSELVILRAEKSRARPDAEIRWNVPKRS